MILTQISHTVIQAMAGLESSERSPTHMSAVRHPHPWVPLMWSLLRRGLRALKQVTQERES